MCLCSPRYLQVLLKHSRCLSNWRVCPPFYRHLKEAPDSGKQRQGQNIKPLLPWRLMEITPETSFSWRDICWVFFQCSGKQMTWDVPSTCVWVCSVVWLSVSTVLFSRPLEHSSSMMETLHPSNSNCPFPPLPQPPANTILLSAFIIVATFHTLTYGGSDSESICLQCGTPGFSPWVGKIPWRRKWQPTLVFLPGKSQGGRSLVGYSRWVPKSRTWLSDFSSTFIHYRRMIVQ